MGEDSTDNIGKITIQLDDLYKSDPTLDYLKRIEEDRKALLSVSDLSAAWGDPTIQERLEDMRVALDYPELQDAFKSYEDYMAVTNPLISALEKDNAQSLLEAFKLDTEPYLDPTYAQTLKATDLFSDTLKNVSHLGLAEVPDYAEEMKKTMALYDDNFGLGNKKLVELATSFENDAFNKSMATMSEALKPTQSVLNSISKMQDQAAKVVEAFTPIKSPWLEKLTESQESIRKITPIFKMPTIEERMLDLPHFEPQRPEDSPHYKLNEKILNNSEEQIILLKQVSVYMSSQSEKLEFLNDMTAKQVEENKITSDKQSEINDQSSKSAMTVALISIFITLLFSIGGLVLTYYVFVQEDISDNKDHAEVVKLLKENNLNGSISELVDQLKIKNKNENELAKLKKENVKMKQELKAKKSK